jgi:hypothetical protein
VFAYCRALSGVFRPVKKHFGLGGEHGLYCFKPTRACHLFDDGASICDIQLLFRHQTPLITMVYLKSLGRVERGAYLIRAERFKTSTIDYIPVDHRQFCKDYLQP